MDVYVARQPIFNENKDIYGYELLFRGGPENFFTEIDGDIATSTVLSHSFFTIGIEKITGWNTAFINFTRDLLLDRVPLLFPREKIVVEIKSFLRASQVVDLEEAVGQYNIYHFFLQQKEPHRTLYLAVPTHAFDNILQREVGRNIINAYGIHVIVYSLSEEEPLLWKPPESFINNV